MIRSFKSRALRRYWEKNDGSKIAPEWLPRISMILDLLDAATEPSDLSLPGLELHGLKGTDRGRYAVKVTGNWRVTFGWQDGDATDVDLEDYH
ncbi:MAG: type II toxin-antitoxin system RelE/ParE family toxin [Hyphomicrobiaceae bacterium]